LPRRELSPLKKKETLMSITLMKRNSNSLRRQEKPPESLKNTTLTPNPSLQVRSMSQEDAILSTNPNKATKMDHHSMTMEKTMMTSHEQQQTETPYISNIANSFT